MKKLASIVLVIAMLFVLSISAFAAVSHQNIPVTDDMQGTNAVKYSGGETITANNADISTGVKQEANIPVSVNTSTTVTNDGSIYAWCVDIFWDDMTFTCQRTATANSWNPDKLQYEADSNASAIYSWSSNANNEIDVSNRSNRDITVTLSFAPKDAKISGEFYYKTETDNGTSATVLTSAFPVPCQPSVDEAGTGSIDQDFYFRFADMTNPNSTTAKAIFDYLSSSEDNTVGSINVTIAGSYNSQPG